MYYISILNLMVLSCEVLSARCWVYLLNSELQLIELHTHIHIHTSIYTYIHTVKLVLIGIC